jgi:hypothetical protein
MLFTSSTCFMMFLLFWPNVDDFDFFRRRAKLFLYGETMLDKGTGNKTWKEKGVGDMRFLK